MCPFQRISLYGRQNDWLCVCVVKCYFSSILTSLKSKTILFSFFKMQLKMLTHDKMAFISSQWPLITFIIALIASSIVLTILHSEMQKQIWAKTQTLPQTTCLIWGYKWSLHLYMPHIMQNVLFSQSNLRHWWWWVVTITHHPSFKTSLRY